MRMHVVYFTSWVFPVLIIGIRASLDHAVLASRMTMRTTEGHLFINIRIIQALCGERFFKYLDSDIQLPFAN